MGLWLFKEEPDTYSYADLEREGETIWNGVTNPLAQKHLRSVRSGDRILFYHTGDERAVVGIMQAGADPQADPEDPTGKRVVVSVKPVKRLPRPVTLAAIKDDPAFADWELVRMSRLSVMPVPPELWRRIEEMAAAGASERPGQKGGTRRGKKE